MADPKDTVAEVTEKTSVQDVATEPQETAEIDSEVAEVLEAAETSDSEEESSTPIKTDVTPDDGEDEVAEFTRKPETKDNVQRRIDQLVAEKKRLEAELAQSKQSTPPKGEPEYSEAQLRKALDEAMEKGDSSLVYEIMDYKANKVKRDLISDYEKQQKAQSEAYQRIHGEWNKVVNDYSRAWEGDEGKELYPGAQDEINLNSANSLLYKVAMALYNSNEDDNPYRMQGGQRMAVADALALILRKRKLSGNSKKLERALAKEKRKRSLGSGSAGETEVASKPKTSKDTLAEVIAERKRYRQERE